MTSCILHENPSSAITIIDIPRSIEIAQGDGTTQRRLLSTEPLKHPFPSLEPKSARASANLGDHSLDDLLLQKRLDLALRELEENYHGVWCLPRVTGDECDRAQKSSPERKRKRGLEEEISDVPRGGEKLQGGSERNAEAGELKAEKGDEVAIEEKNNRLFCNPSQQTISTEYGPAPAKVFLPPKSTALCGDITSTREIFTQHAPKFDMILMDPPWPNRSARRKKGYDISYNQSDIRWLLSQIPVPEHLKGDGLVGIWITNKPAFRDLTLELFEEWGVGLVEEVTWLKVTAGGQPICALDSRWRKPYEVLLIGKRGAVDCEVEKRVLVAVPDLHSRKTNLKGVFQKIIIGRGDGEGEGEGEEEYAALEVFARSLTAGWWGWGNEVLKFQEEDCWIGSVT